MARTEIITAFIISFISFLFLFSVSVNAATSNINIQAPNNNTQFSGSDPVTVSGQVNLLSGDVDPTKYGVTVYWGDGTITNCISLTGSANPYSYTTAPSNNHVYSTSGTKIITAALFHQCAQGQDKSKADAVADVNIVILPVCTISASPDLNFGSMNPVDTSGDQSTTITNAGTSATTSLTVKGTDWTPTMLAGQTHWSLLSGQDYITQMSTLTTGDVSLGQNVNGGGNLPVYFKLRIPVHQAGSSYTQTITFTGSC